MAAARSKLPKIDATTQRLCAFLADELGSWPNVTQRPMFGMVAFYVRGNIFAALPRTRAAETPFSLLLKLPGVQQHQRLTRASKPRTGWTTFELESPANVKDALRWLEEAYNKASARWRE